MNPKPTENARARLVRWLLALCAQETTSGQEDAGLPNLREILRELGAELLEQPVAEGRTNVLALWGEPRVVFSTHLDTVPPYFPPLLEGEIIHGRGSCDAKGQIVAQLGAIAELLAEGHRDIAWFGVVGEETDSAGAAASLQLSTPFHACKALVIGEPTGLKLATGQRGVQHFVLRSHGKAAHSSTPEDGASALWPLIDWLQQLRERARPTDPDLGAEIWNLGILEGGDAVNKVPDFAMAHVHARVLPGSDLEACIHNLRPPQGEVERRLSEPPDRYPRIPGFEHAPMPFGSDAPQMRALVPDRTVVLAGPGSIRFAHTLEERITIPELEGGVALNKRLALHFLDLDDISTRPL
jgi:acetylornithine deacetylase